MYSVLSPFRRARLFATPWTIVHQAPLSMGFSRQESWSGLPFPSPGDLPNPGIGAGSPASPALADRFFTTSTAWEALHMYIYTCKRLSTQREHVHIYIYIYTHTHTHMLIYMHTYIYIYICMCVLCTQMLQSCLTLRPFDCSPPSFSVHGILQARILEWVAISSSRGSS